MKTKNTKYQSPTYPLDNTKKSYMILVAATRKYLAKIYPQFEYASFADWPGLFYKLGRERK